MSYSLFINSFQNFSKLTVFFTALSTTLFYKSRLLDLLHKKRPNQINDWVLKKASDSTPACQSFSVGMADRCSTIH
jgi:hypothetical protein